MKKPSKLPRDANQLAKAIVDLSTGTKPTKRAGAPKKATPARGKKGKA